VEASWERLAATVTFHHHPVCHMDSARSTNKDMYVCCCFLCVCVCVCVFTSFHWFLPRDIWLACPEGAMSLGSVGDQLVAIACHNFPKYHCTHTHTHTQSCSTHVSHTLGRGDTVLHVLPRQCEVTQFSISKETGSPPSQPRPRGSNQSSVIFQSTAP